MIARNISLRCALALASRLGLSVRPIRRTGEVGVSEGGKFLRVSVHRHDAPARLVTMLRRAAKEG